MNTQISNLSKSAIANVNMLWGSVIAETLARLGAQNAIISPGSRNGPLTIGFASNEKIETIPVLDERSAAFFALGLAKQKNKPVVLACSSGTGAANYFPAIIEASITNVPLMVFTADRPKEMHNCYSGQTMDQTKLYGNYPRWYCELALPELKKDLFHYLRQTMLHAWERTRYPTAGPVHINAPFRDPLAPLTDDTTSTFIKSFNFNKFFDAIQIPPKTTPVIGRTNTIKLLQKLESYSKGIIVVGPYGPINSHAFSKEIGTVSRALGWPVFAEGLSPLRNYSDRIPHLITRYDLILRNAQIEQLFKPDAVLNIGPLPTSKVLREWLRKLEVPTWTLSPSPDNIDPLHRDTIPIHTTTTILSLFLQQTKPRSTKFSEDWNALEVKAQQQINTLFKKSDVLFEGKVSWLLSQYLATDTPVFIANSMPARDVEFFWVANTSRFAIHFNRGINGIDGILSTALGTAHKNKPSVLLTGDLAFLHDFNGLLMKEHFKGHLSIILINNNGGGIFETLPISQFKEVFELYFATPQKVNIKKLVASHGIDVETPRSWSEFLELISTLPSDGIRLIEIKTDRKHDTQYRQELIMSAANNLLN